MSRWLVFLFFILSLVGCASAPKKQSVSPPLYSGIGEAIASPAEERESGTSVNLMAVEMIDPTQEQEDAPLQEFVAAVEPNTLSVEGVVETSIVDKGAFERHFFANGDQLGQILSDRCSFSRLGEVANLNRIDDANIVHPGQLVLVPASACAIQDAAVVQLRADVVRSHLLEGGAENDIAAPEAFIPSNGDVVTIRGKRYDFSTGGIARPLPQEQIEAPLLTQYGSIPMLSSGGWTGSTTGGGVGMGWVSPSETTFSAQVLDGALESEIEGLQKDLAATRGRIEELETELASLRSERDGARHALADERGRFRALIAMLIGAVVLTALGVWFLRSWQFSRERENLLEINGHFSDRIRDLDSSLEDERKRVASLEQQLGVEKLTNAGLQSYIDGLEERIKHVPLPAAQEVVDKVDRLVDWEQRRNAEPDRRVRPIKEALGDTKREIPTMPAKDSSKGGAGGSSLRQNKKAAG